MKTLFRTGKGILADLPGEPVQTEAAQLKQQLQREGQEAPMVRIKILKRVSMGWCSAMPGEEREVTEEQLKILEAQLPGRTERMDPPAEAAPEPAKDEGLADDVPGAPPPGKDKKLGKKKGKRRRREA